MDLGDTSHLTLGWVGLGSMGGAMARNIQKSLGNQRQLRVFNRTASKCESVERLGGKRCESVGQLAKESDLVFISASDDAAVVSLVDQILDSGDVQGKIVVDTTTIHPDTSSAIAVRLGAAGASFASMPVFGASPVAEQGKLLAAFAGPKGVYETIRSLLKGVVAREVLFAGSAPEKATLLKTTGNILMASLMQIIAEAHVFAEKTGVPAETLEKLLELNFGPVMHSDSVRMTTGVYCPGPGENPWSGLDLGIKDVGIGVSIAEREGVSLKAGKTALENMEKAREWAAKEGGRKLDSSGLFGVVRQDSHLDFKTEIVKQKDKQA